MTKLCKISLIGISAITLFLGAVVYSYSGINGFYVPFLDIVVCKDSYTCLHETAHGFDNGRSETREFANAVQLFRIVADTNNSVDEMSYRIRKFPGIGSEFEQTTCRIFIKCELKGWGGYSELYAEIYAMAGGDIQNIPEIFRPFYEVTNGK
jgi:hypothetical protein